MRHGVPVPQRGRAHSAHHVLSLIAYRSSRAPFRAPLAPQMLRPTAEGASTAWRHHLPAPVLCVSACAHTCLRIRVGARERARNRKKTYVTGTWTPHRVRPQTRPKMPVPPTCPRLGARQLIATTKRHTRTHGEAHRKTAGGRPWHAQPRAARHARARVHAKPCAPPPPSTARGGALPQPV